MSVAFSAEIKKPSDGDGRRVPRLLGWLLAFEPSCMRRLALGGELSRCFTCGSKATCVSSVNVIEAIQTNSGKFTEWRRDFHMHPELGFEVFHSLCYVFFYKTSSRLEHSPVYLTAGAGSPDF